MICGEPFKEDQGKVRSISDNGVYFLINIFFYKNYKFWTTCLNLFSSLRVLILTFAPFALFQLMIHPLNKMLNDLFI